MATEKKVELPAQPPIDILKAYILERKNAYGYTWQDIADKAHYLPDTVRKNVSDKHSDEWSIGFKKAICEALGLKVKVEITLSNGEVLKL